MGTSAASVTATYKDITVSIDTANLSVNLIEFAGWETGVDEYGSTATIDSSNLKTAVSSVLTTVADDEVAEKYAFAKITGYFEKPFSNSSSFKISYSANKPVRFILEQEPLSGEGTAFGFDLPAGDTILYLPLNRFTQPDWIEALQKADLDMNAVTSFGFEAVERSATTTFELTELKATNYKIDTVSIGTNSTRSSLLAVSGMNRSALTLSIPTEGIYRVSVHSLTGRTLFEQRTRYSEGIRSIDCGISTTGMYLVSVQGAGKQVTAKILLR